MIYTRTSTCSINVVEPVRLVVIGEEGGVEQSCLLMGARNEVCLVGIWRWVGEPQGSLCCSFSTRAFLVSTAWGADFVVNLFLLHLQRRAVVKSTGPAEPLAEMKCREGMRTSRLALRTVKRPFPSRPGDSGLCLDAAGCQLGDV